MNKNKITVSISFIGVIDIKNIENNSSIELEQNSTVNDLLGLAGIKREHKKYIIATVNEEIKHGTCILRDNDAVKLFLPIGGG